MTERKKGKPGKTSRPAESERAQEELLERLTRLGEGGRRPLDEFLRVSESMGEELRLARNFLFDLFCQIYNITPETLDSEAGRLLRFKFFQELGQGSTLQEIKDLFIRGLFVAESEGFAGLKERPARATGLARRAKGYIDANYGDRLSLNAVAESLSVSKEHLSRAFKRAYGVTVTEYIHQVRVDMAKSLIREGELSLKEICYELGYQSYNDFYRNFRKSAGVSPKDWRED